MAGRWCWRCRIASSTVHVGEERVPTFPVHYDPALLTAACRAEGTAYPAIGTGGKRRGGGGACRPATTRAWAPDLDEVAGERADRSQVREAPCHDLHVYMVGFLPGHPTWRPARNRPAAAENPRIKVPPDRSPSPWPRRHLRARAPAGGTNLARTPAPLGTCAKPARRSSLPATRSCSSRFRSRVRNRAGGAGEPAVDGRNGAAA